MKTREQWVKENWPAVVKATQGTGIFPETLMAIAIIESQGKVNGTWYPGQGLVAKKANNFFGIKNSTAWKGRTIELPTPGDAQKVSSFRVYPSFYDSVNDFVKFLQTNQRYPKAGVFTAQNYVEQIIRIAKAGYSESATYSDLVQKVANSVKKYVQDSIIPIANNGRKILPLLVAGLIVTAFLIAQNK